MYLKNKQYPIRLATLVFMLIILFVSTAGAAEQLSDRPLEKVTIAYSSISGHMAPLWVTYERGFFRKYGLDVQLVFIESGSTAVKSLMSKEVAFAQMAGAGVVQSRLQGTDVVMIAGFLNTMDYQLMVDKSITRPDQLKGKTMAVSRFGSSSDFAIRYALDKYGLVPEKDVTILEIGSQPARFAALGTGKIQAAMIAVPLTLKAKALGSKYLKTNDTEVLTEVYQGIGLTLTPQKPYPTLRGIEVMLRELAARDPKAKAARPEEFVDLTFVKELDSSGFIDRLYKTQPVVASREDAGSSPASPVIKEKPKPAPGKEAASIARGASSLPQTYTVTAGDTLSHLAFRFYGSSNKWPQIHQANANTLKNPHYLYIGQQLMIPPDGKAGG